MPPRQRNTQPSSPDVAAAQLGLRDLPDELLLRVLECLPLAGRCGACHHVSATKSECRL